MPDYLKFSIETAPLLLFVAALIFHIVYFKFKRYQDLLTTLFSIAFYVAFSALTIGLPIYVTAVVYLFSKKISSTKNKLVHLIGAALLLILPLFVYKLLQAEILPGGHQFILRWGIPIGISYYTFQGLAYLFDLSRGLVAAPQSLFKLLGYLTYFPKLIAGPIERPTDFQKRINAKISFCPEDFRNGIWLMSLGLMKIFVFAAPIYYIVQPVFENPAAASSIHILLVPILARYQIYFDFSGYTDLARGAARMHGSHLMKNFDAPFQVTNISDYWSRWHISLSSWMRDYVFYPVSLKLKLKWAPFFALFLSFFLIGIWHGLSLNFIVYGGIHAAAIAIHQVIKRPLAQLLEKVGQKAFSSLVAVVGWMVTFLGVVCLSSLLFWNKDLNATILYLGSLKEINLNSLVSGVLALSIEEKRLIFMVLLFELMLLFHRRIQNFADWLSSQQSWARLAVYFLYLVTMLLFSHLGEMVAVRYAAF